METIKACCIRSIIKRDTTWINSHIIKGQKSGIHMRASGLHLFHEKTCGRRILYIIIKAGKGKGPLRDRASRLNLPLSSHGHDHIIDPSQIGPQVITETLIGIWLTHKARRHPIGIVAFNQKARSIRIKFYHL